MASSSVQLLMEAVSLAYIYYLGKGKKKNSFNYKVLQLFLAKTFS